MGGATDIVIVEVRLKSKKIVRPHTQCVTSYRHHKTIVSCVVLLVVTLLLTKQVLSNFVCCQFLKVSAPQIVPYCEIELKKCDCELNGTCLSF